MTSTLAELKDTREAIKNAYEAKGLELNDFADAIVVEGTEVKVDQEKFLLARGVEQERAELQKALVHVESILGMRQFDENPTRIPAAAADYAGQGGGEGGDGFGFKTLGESFVESDAFAEFKQIASRSGVSRSFMSEGRNLKRLLAAAEMKDLYTAVGGTLTRPAFGTSEGPNIIPRLHRTARVRDLFPSQKTTSNLIEFIRVSGFTNNAAMIPQREDGSGNPVAGVGGVNFGLKPSSDLAFTTGLAPVRTIAHNIRVHKSTLDDEPRLRGIIDTEMLYGLQLKEDSQFMQGDGTGENVLGFLNTPLHQVYTQRNDGHTPAPPNPTERMSDSIRRMATLVQLAYVEPTGVVLHPFDWEEIELERSANGLYTIVVNAQVGAEQRLWRLPVVSTPAIPQGTALVGAFGIAAQVWDREEANIIVSTEDRDNVVRNAVTIQAEERVALEVTRPEAFVVGTLYGEPAVNSAG